MPRPEGRPRSPVAEKTSLLAIFSLLCGILTFCIPCLTTLPGVILGILGLMAIGNSEGRVKGKGMAIAGLVTSVLGSVVSIGVIVVAFSIFGLALPAFLKVGEASSRIKSTNDLKEIGLALHQYHDSNLKMPPSVLKGPGPKGKPYSWRVAILPYIEQQNLYMRYNFDETWDSPANKDVLDHMPKIYALPQAGNSAPANHTYYQMFVGKNTPGESPGMTLSRIAQLNGTNNTILVVEAANPVPWTKPEDLSYAPNSPLPPLGGHFSKGYLALFCDGTVDFIPKDTDDKLLRGMITYAEGDPGARSKIHK